MQDDLPAVEPSSPATDRPSAPPLGATGRWSQLRSVWTRLGESPLVYRLARGAFWSLLGTIAGRGAAFLSFLVIARVLGREGFGQLGVVQSTLQMFQVFAGFSLGLTATKYVSENRERDRSLAGRVIALTMAVALCTGVTVTLLLIAGADVLARSTLNAPGMAGPLRIASILLLLGALNGAQTGVLSGFEAFRETARINTLIGLASFVALIVGACVGGLNGVLWGMVAVGILTWLLNWSLIQDYQRRYQMRSSPRDAFRELGILWRFSLPSVIGSAVVFPTLWISNALLVNQPNGYAEMGYLNAMANWRAILIYIPTVINQVTIPIMCSQTDERATLRISFSLMVVMALPLAAAVMFLATPILGLYGPSFAAGHSVLIGGMAMLVFQCISGPLMSSLWSKGRMWLCFGLNVLWAVIQLGFIALTVSSWGASAVAFGSALAYLVQTLFTFHLLAAELPAGILRRAWGCTALTAGLVALSLSVGPVARLWLAAPVVLVTLGLSLAFLADPQFARRARDLVARTR